MGARFAKWRAVIAIGEGIPSQRCIEAKANALARYAALCQETGLMPMETCYQITEQAPRTVFNKLYSQRVKLEGMILKPPRWSFQD